MPSEDHKEREDGRFLGLPVAIWVALIGLVGTIGAAWIAISARVGTGVASPTPTPTCPYSALTDSEALTGLIDAEAEAVRHEDMAQIIAIYASDAVIRNEATGEEWSSPEAYYTEKFLNETHCAIEHNAYAIERVTAAEAFVTTGNEGRWGMGDTCTMTYENPAGADEWSFRKDEAGCWQIVRFCYNTHQRTP